MPLYEFTCPDCGPFEARLHVGAAGRCPGCGSEGRRVYSPPGLALLHRPLRRALDAEEKSAHEPAVVTEKRGRPMRGHHGCC